ncbi:MAG: ArnT family glycosyltransferase, partial [Ktedonobacterales bacterium]
MTSAMRAQPQPQSRVASLARLIAGPLEGRLAALLALVTVALILWPLNGLERDYDEGVYWQSLRAMASGHALFSSVFSSQPPFFLVSLYPFYTLFGQSIAAARFGVAFFAIIGVIAMYWLGRALGGHWVGLAAAALLAFDPSFLHEARTLQAEAPAIALEVVAVALALAASRRGATRDRTLLALASGFALALGVLIKLLDVVALVPIVLYLATPLWPIFSDDAGRVRRPALSEARPLLRAALAPVGWMVAGGVIGCVLVLAPFAGSFGALWQQVVSFHLAAARAEPANLPENLATIAGGMRVLGIPTLLALGLAVWQRAWRLA